MSVDELPDGWTKTTLGELGRYLNGRAFKSTEWSKSGRPIVRIQDLTGTNSNPNYFEGVVEDRYVVRPGDLLISWAATLGAYIWDGPEAVLNQHIFKVESDVDRRFHFHLVRRTLAQLQEQAHGSGMVHVTKGMFDSTPVVVPLDKQHQRDVASAIDTADELRSAVERRLDRARRMTDASRRALLAAACSGALTADWRSEHPTADPIDSALEARSGSRRTSRRTEVTVDLPMPDVPDTYRISTVGHAAEVIEYGTSTRCGTTGDVAVVRMGNIQDGQLDLADLKYCGRDDEIDRLLLADGDLLFNRTNSPELVGKSAVFHHEGEFSFASYLIRVRFHSDVADPDFVNYWLNSGWGREWARLAKADGVSQSNINGTKLAMMPIPLPPVEEQREIVMRTRHMLGRVDSIEARIAAATRACARSSQALLAKAFRGELVG